MARHADPAAHQAAHDPGAATTPAVDPAAAPPRPKARATRPAASTRSGVAFVEPRVLPIQKATDLGSVQVLKHGNLYLLTDPFGDIHPDSRGLGLYLSDTRMLSCCSAMSEWRI